MIGSDQKILFVTGKGGVGKSTIAAAIALRLSLCGKKILLIELNERSQYSDIFQLSISYQPTEWKKNLWVASWNGENCLRDYLLHYLRIETIVNLFFNNSVMKAFIQTAPALREISILGKLTSGIRNIGPQFDYDHMVIDAYATGHFLALLRAPQGLAETVRFGPMGEQSKQIEKILKDPQYCQYTVVTLPEELPLSECKELAEELKNEWNSSPRIVCNRYWDIPATKKEILQFKDLLPITDQKGKNYWEYIALIKEQQQNTLASLRHFTSEHDLLPFIFSHSDAYQLIEILAERLTWYDSAF